MRTAALAAGLLIIVSGLGLGAGTWAPSADWRAKADGELLEAYDAGQAAMRVLLRGGPMPEPAAEPADRAAWRAFWEAASAPFRGAVRADVERLGGEVTLESPAINALFAQLPRDAVPEVVARADVRRAALDWVGATHLLDAPPSGGLPPAEGGPGLAVTLGDAGAKIQVQDLWAQGFRGEGVIVAVLDTGVRRTHEMMKNADGTTRVAKWLDASDSNCNNPCDGNGHGTHTTTTAVGSNLFNPSSPQGMAPRATVWHAKVLSDGGSGAWEWGQEGLQWAFDNGADITSNSWGGTCSGPAMDTADLAEALARAGMLSVFAAGNAGPGAQTVDCPGLADMVTTVGAVDLGEGVAGFSSRGPCNWKGVVRLCPDVMAVGVNLEAGWYTSDTAYVAISGTSMSTPGIAGLAALLEQASKTLRGRGLDAARKETEVLLRHTAKDLGVAGPDNDFGWGLAKGKVAHDVLAAAPALDLRVAAPAPPANVYGSTSALLTFAVANLGTVNATGQFRHEVRQVSFGGCPPACDVLVISDRAVTLASGEAYSTHLYAGADHAPGTYVVTATFAYTYTDPADGLVKSGEVRRTATFDVRKVLWQAVQGFPASVRAGSLVAGGIALANVGNDAATSVRVTEDFNPRGFVPAPAVPPGGAPYGALANPSPSAVSSPSQNVNAPKVRYEWSPGTIAAGAAWDADVNFVAGQPGTYAFNGRITYRDSGGAQLVQTFDLPSQVLPPA